MSQSDPVADFLTRVRNANTASHTQVDVPRSKIIKGITQVLLEEGFIQDFREIEDNKQGLLRIYLKYGPKGEKVINEIKRQSKPGRRAYVKADGLEPVLSGFGIAILSTSQGVLSDKKCRQLRVGGELLCTVW
ncbi:MAG: 30S ribosomal protein S8 [Planctomycetes bacterium DG_23]|nr:MAG: 30S ribosomal protein S8 [Planctomycetes bacterium DG_23]